MPVGVTHDISLGGTEFRLTQGGYRRRPAPLRGARIATGDYGYGDLSIWQHWHQFCWNGGLGADKWVDDAMFDEGVGVDTTIADQMSLSRDLLWTAGSTMNEEARGRPRKYITYESPHVETPRLYCITFPWLSDTFGTSVWKYQDWDDTWVKVKEFNADWKARSVVTFSGELCIGMSNGKIRRSSNPSNASSWKTTAAPKKVKGKAINAMYRFSGRLYVAYRDKVYRRKPNWKIDGKTVFYDAAGSSPIMCMEEHLGFLYMGSKNGHIHRTDGNNSFDIWSWDGGTQIKAMRSFDGRLFVGTYEYTDDDDLGFQGIYQFTGSAVTQLKKWGKRDRATMMGDFTEYDRKLFYGASSLWGMNEDIGGTDHGGFGVAVFDPIEDAHSVWATNKDTNTYPDSTGTGKSWIVDDVIFWQGNLHAAVRGWGNFKTKVGYRDYIDGLVEYDTTKEAATGRSNAGFLRSSNYDGGTPGLLKDWRDFTLTGFFPLGTSGDFFYSVDKGVTWTAIGSITGADDGETHWEWFLRDADGKAPRSHQMMYRVELDSDDSSKSPIVHGVTLAYLPMPEPNWVWDISLTLTQKVVLLDRTTEVTDPKALELQLATWFREQTLLDFVDMDGIQWPEGVMLWDYNADYHVPANAEDPEEWRVRLSLLEVQQGAP